MSEKDQKDLPKADDAPDEGDIDNLSQTEKAAFEKIMAQISEADDDATDSKADKTETIPASDPEVPSDTPPKDNGSASSETVENEEGQDDDEKNEDDLSDDQRQALDKIMAEIAGEDEKPNEDPVDNENDDDQQAALDQVMAEIETEESATDDTAEPADDDALSDDQQAALDQIMAEIKGGEEEERDTDEDDIPAHAEQTDNSEQPEPVVKKETAADTAEAAPANAAKADGLSMEEFDDELSSLLNPSSDETPTKNKEVSGATSKAPPPSSPDQSLEDINSALKNIVKTSDDKEKKSTSVPEADTPQEKPETEAGRLKEVETNPTPNKKTFGIQPKKVMLSGAIAGMVLLLGIGAYWGYQQYLERSTETPEVALVPGAPAELETILSDKQLPDSPPKPAPAEQAEPDPAITKAEPFGTLKADIVETRKYIQQKKEEILDLKRYYKNGIQEERNKLLALQTKPPLGFKEALESRPIELGLRSIQRRASYNLKLDTPLAQVETHLEQLLYLERRIRLFELLDNTISGLSLADLKRDGTNLITRLRKESEQLSVENVESAIPSLKSIWQEIRLGAPSGSGADVVASRTTPHNQKISHAICKGNFERKYQLTALTPQTAKCLANWPGKDLYLNGLTHLSPKVAKQLALWPGEWLSLNGIKRLSPEAARHLSKWPGKRLSLNGVSILSDEATTYLAQWQGEQLEMIGLTAIGRWENYVTHLFLSERLRRELQVK